MIQLLGRLIVSRTTESEAITQREIALLKKRRDVLLNTACTRFERPKILAEVRRINEKLRVLHVQLGRIPVE